MLFPGLTLVISPLISLMKDQVGALVEAGVPAACINSAMSAEEFRDALYFAGRGQYKLLYVAPERLTAPSFLEFAKRVPISMVTVDEAHCISQWGQDFRPSYLKILDFLAELPERPLVSAFTATATAEVRDDIVQALGLHEPFIKTTGFDRPNLYFAVEQPTSKGMKLLQLLKQWGQDFVQAGTPELPGRSFLEFTATATAEVRRSQSMKPSSRPPYLTPNGDRIFGQATSKSSTF